MNNKEITCRLVDGKPVVENKEEYVPKNGHIVVVRYPNEAFLGIYGSRYHSNYIMKAVVCLKSNEPESFPEFGFDLDHNLLVNTAKIFEATFEEVEVMLHFLNENGYELVGDTVIKKRWMPKMGEGYYYPGIEDLVGVICKKSNRGMEDDSIYKVAFKTEDACRKACDEANKLLLTLPQE